MFHTPCVICRKKNYSDIVEQLKRIRTFLYRENLEMVKVPKNVHIASAFISSTGHHCSYGLCCNTLNDFTNEANNIAREIENNIVAYIQKADAGELHALLSFTRGYFPQAYVAIERYWYLCHRKE